MDCPKCNREMMICGFDYTATGDGSPDTPTRLYHVALCECQNPDCEMKGVKFSAGATELPKAQVERRFCRKCGALLAELENGKLIFPPSVTERRFVNGEYHIRCPACESEEVLLAGNTEEPPAQPPAEEPAKEPTEEHAPGA